MSCESCKNKDKNTLSVFHKNGEKVETEPKTTDVGFQIFNYSIRILIFAISLLATPLIMLFVVYLMFKTIILNNGEINLTPTLLSVAKTLGIGKKKVEEEHPEDYEDLDSNKPDEYEIYEKVDKV